MATIPVPTSAYSSSTKSACRNRDSNYGPKCVYSYTPAKNTIIGNAPENAFTHGRAIPVEQPPDTVNDVPKADSVNCWTWSASNLGQQPNMLLSNDLSQGPGRAIKATNISIQDIANIVDAVNAINASVGGDIENIVEVVEVAKVTAIKTEKNTEQIAATDVLVAVQQEEITIQATQIEETEVALVATNTNVQAVQTVTVEQGVEIVDLQGGTGTVKQVLAGSNVVIDSSPVVGSGQGIITIHLPAIGTTAVHSVKPVNSTGLIINPMATGTGDVTIDMSAIIQNITDNTTAIGVEAAKILALQSGTGTVKTVTSASPGVFTVAPNDGDVVITAVGTGVLVNSVNLDPPVSLVTIDPTSNAVLINIQPLENLALNNAIDINNLEAGTNTVKQIVAGTNVTLSAPGTGLGVVTVNATVPVQLVETGTGGTYVQVAGAVSPGSSGIFAVDSLLLDQKIGNMSDDILDNYTAIGLNLSSINNLKTGGNLVNGTGINILYNDPINKATIINTGVTQLTKAGDIVISGSTGNIQISSTAIDDLIEANTLAITGILDGTNLLPGDGISLQKDTIANTTTITNTGVTSLTASTGIVILQNTIPPKDGPGDLVIYSTGGGGGGITAGNVTGDYTRWKDGIWLPGIGTATLGNEGAISIGTQVPPLEATDLQGVNAIALGTEAGRISQLLNSIAIGTEAGKTNQGTPDTTPVDTGQSIAIGYQAGMTTQRTNCVAIGTLAGLTDQGQPAMAHPAGGAIAIGWLAGNITQEPDAIAIGQEAGLTTQKQLAIAIGYRAGKTTQGTESIAIGVQAAWTNQGDNSIAIGGAAWTNQSDNAIAIGHTTAWHNQGEYTIAIGDNTGFDNQEDFSIAIGPNAGKTNQGIVDASISPADPTIGHAIAMGFDAGNFKQKHDTIAIGTSAASGLGPGTGDYGQKHDSIAIGSNAGVNTQEPYSIAMGYQAGQLTQGIVSASSAAVGKCIAIGYQAGNTAQQNDAIAIGSNAGQSGQEYSTIAIGELAGFVDQNDTSIAIGKEAGKTEQGRVSVAIGNGAGKTEQRGSSIAIGGGAGSLYQGSNCVAIGPGAGREYHGFGSHSLPPGLPNGPADGAIAIGTSAGYYRQGNYSIAIGFNAASGVQGSAYYQRRDSVAIGTRSGYNTGIRTIALGYEAGYYNLGGGNFGQQPSNSFTIGKECIREQGFVESQGGTPGKNLMYYNQTTGEISYGSTTTTPSLPSNNEILQYNETNNVWEATGLIQLGENAVADLYCVALGSNAIANTSTVSSVAIGKQITSTKNSIIISTTGAQMNNEDEGEIILNTLSSESEQNGKILIGINLGASSEHASSSIAIGREAGKGTGAFGGDHLIAIGYKAGQSSVNQGIAIGVQAGMSGQRAGAFALGQQAGETIQGANCIAIGTLAGYTNQGSVGLFEGRSIAIGLYAGKVDQGESSIALGYNAALNDQASNAIAIGESAGQDDQEGNTIAIGRQAGLTGQRGNAIALGEDCGMTNQGPGAIALGQNAGNINQKTYSIAIGERAGFVNQQDKSIAIGHRTGGSSGIDPLIGQRTACVAIGDEAGGIDQGAFSIAIGHETAMMTQLGDSIAIGNQAGKTDQQANNIAIGYFAGNANQQPRSVAIGYNAGETTQSVNCVAIGYDAGQTDQKSDSVAIGYFAGNDTQGNNCVAIGYQAGQANQPNGSLYIGKTCIRNRFGDTMLQYDTGTGEISRAPLPLLVGLTANWVFGQSGGMDFPLQPGSYQNIYRNPAGNTQSYANSWWGETGRSFNSSDFFIWVTDTNISPGTGVKYIGIDDVKVSIFAQFVWRSTDPAGDGTYSVAISLNGGLIGLSSQRFYVASGGSSTTFTMSADNVEMTTGDVAAMIIAAPGIGTDPPRAGDAYCSIVRVSMISSSSPI